jgi:NADPH-dependent curcumin reductase CurA
MPDTGLEVHLAARPVGVPRTSDFRIVEVTVSQPGPGEVLVRNDWMSVDPYMRGRMDDRESYVPPFELDRRLDGSAAGEVLASNAPELAPGDTVHHHMGWRQYAVLPATGARRIDTSEIPIEVHLGVLGLTGLTAFVGLIDIAQLREGDVVFVSAAAGAVGSAACQIARLRGHRVIGSAGSANKVAYVKEDLGLDAAFNYRDGRVRELLRAVAPDGIDVYFDNVAGEHLEGAIDAMHEGGRAALCGFISGYDKAEPPPGPRNMSLVVTKRLTLRGFLLTDHLHRRAAFLEEAAVWMREGRLRNRVTVVEGLENAAAAFIGLLGGENIGKMLVKLS